MKKWELFTVSIVAIIKNEGLYIKEWLDYHRMIGVQKFYLYDNGSDDDTYSVLQEYINEGVVEYSFFPGEKKQLQAYNDAVRRHRFQSKYMLFLDCDEFVRSTNEKSLAENIEEIVCLHPHAGGIGIGWRMFGSSKREEKAEEGVLRGYTWRTDDDYFENEHVKIIVNPRRIIKVVNPHQAYYLHGYTVVDENGNKKYGPRFKTTRRKLCINHYFCKSKEEWIKRRSMGKADMIGTRTLEEFERVNRYEKIEDRDILKSKYAISPVYVKTNIEYWILILSFFEDLVKTGLMVMADRVLGKKYRW